MHDDVYYRHSGQFPLGETILATLAAAGAGCVLAVLYAALVFYIPLAGAITFLLAIGFGIGVGFATAFCLKRARIRHEGVTFLASAVAALSAFYASWASWSWLLLRQADGGASLAALLPQPGLVWAFVNEVNAIGAWSMSGFTPTGAVLWVLWGGEALLVLLPATLLPLGVLSIPFCERCERWCDEATDVARFAHDGSADALKTRLECKEISALEGLGAPGVSDDTWYRADLHDCPSCRELHTLTLKTITVRTNDRGERDEVEEDVVNQLLVTSHETGAIRALATNGSPRTPPKV